MNKMIHYFFLKVSTFLESEKNSLENQDSLTSENILKVEDVFSIYV